MAVPDFQTLMRVGWVPRTSTGRSSSRVQARRFAVKRDGVERLTGQVGLEDKLRRLTSYPKKS